MGHAFACLSMPGPGNSRKTSVTLSSDTKDRLASARVHPRESFDQAVNRLLDEHDARAAASPAASGPENPGLIGRIRPVFRRTITGRDPRDKHADAASVASLPPTEVAT